MRTRSQHKVASANRLAILEGIELRSRQEEVLLEDRGRGLHPLEQLAMYCNRTGRGRRNSADSVSAPSWWSSSQRGGGLLLALVVAPDLSVAYIRSNGNFNIGMQQLKLKRISVVHDFPSNSLQLFPLPTDENCLLLPSFVA